MIKISVLDESGELKELLEHLISSTEEALTVWGQITSLSDQPLTDLDVWRVRTNIQGMIMDSHNLMGIVLEVENKFRDANYV